MRQARFIVGILILIIGGGGIWIVMQDGHFGPVSGSGGSSGQARLGGPFELTDHLGNPVTDASYEGRYMLIFFGYTFCPDMCPTTLGTISTAMDLLGDEAKKVRPLFVSVDPDRDTPESLREYLVHFHPAIVGLTGNAAQIKNTAKAYGVYYARAQADETDPEDYLVDHTTLTFLMDEDGDYAAHFSHNTDAAAMADRIKAILSGAG